MKQQRRLCILVCGQSGSGKSTFSHVLVQYLKSSGLKGMWYNGDYVRQLPLSADLGFTDEDRMKQAARAGSVVNIALNCSDLDFVVVDLIAPTKKARETFRGALLAESSIMSKRADGSMIKDTDDVFFPPSIQFQLVHMHQTGLPESAYSTRFEDPEDEGATRVIWSPPLSYDAFVRTASSVHSALMFTDGLPARP